MEIIITVLCLILVGILLYWIFENLKTEKRKKLLINLLIEKSCYELKEIVPDFNLNDYTEH